MPCTSNSLKERIDFTGIDVEVVDEERLFNRIADFVHQRKPHKVMYLNAHCMVVSQKDGVYREILKNADLVYADGISLVWGARFLGQYLPCRLTAADFMPRFFTRFAREGISVYMLGAKPGVAETMARRLKERNPELKIAGTHHGYFGKMAGADVIEDINRTKPDIVMVGMGVPYQEKWIEDNYDSIDASVIWGVGALFDFLSGSCPRGPQWLLDSGFEWLCRLLAEPKRLWRRYLIGNLLFVRYLLQWKMKAHRKDAESAKAK